MKENLFSVFFDETVADGNPVDGPSGLLVDPRTRSIFVAAVNSDNVFRITDSVPQALPVPALGRVSVLLMIIALILSSALAFHSRSVGAR